MKLTKKQILMASFTLFSLFFGAGNLIFPPYLGQSAGNAMPLALLGFWLTAVVLPILGVIVVAKYDGLQNLAEKVSKHFGILFSILIYVSIGPGLGIPRAASLPFEMAVAPYIQTTHLQLLLFLFSLVFFLVAMTLALNPGKMVERFGKILTPTLLILLMILFGSFMIAGPKNIGEPIETYASSPFVKGFLEGYMTMDTIAALNFGLVISLTIHSFQVTEKQRVMHYTIVNGIFAGLLLTGVYVMLSVMGMYVSGVFELGSNGAVTLRALVYAVFGENGAFLLASIFTLACLTTCVGLITSISQFFSKLLPKVSYKQWVMVITLFSFIICNQGLDALLSLSVPLLNAIYPMAIVLIVLGLIHKALTTSYMFPVTMTFTSIVSVVYALESWFQVPVLSNLFSHLPGYTLGLGWVLPALVGMIVGMIWDGLKKYGK